MNTISCFNNAKVDVPFIPDNGDCLRMLETSNQKDYNVFQRFLKPRIMKDCKVGLKKKSNSENGQRMMEIPKPFSKLE